MKNPADFIVALGAGLAIALFVWWAVVGAGLDKRVTAIETQVAIVQEAPHDPE